MDQLTQGETRTDEQHGKVERENYHHLAQSKEGVANLIANQKFEDSQDGDFLKASENEHDSDKDNIAQAVQPSQEKGRKKVTKRRVRNVHQKAPGRRFGARQISWTREETKTVFDYLDKHDQLDGMKGRKVYGAMADAKVLNRTASAIQSRVKSLLKLENRDQLMNELDDDELFEKIQSTLKNHKRKGGPLPK